MVETNVIVMNVVAVELGTVEVLLVIFLTISDLFLMGEFAV